MKTLILIIIVSFINILLVDYDCCKGPNNRSKSFASTYATQPIHATIVQASEQRGHPHAFQFIHAIIDPICRS